MFFHASNIANIKELLPGVSMHGESLVYLTKKRENSLVYLSNAVEKYCKEIGYSHKGKYYKWCSYGFGQDGLLELQEYWPDAAADTYAGVKGYVYSVQQAPQAEDMKDIPHAVTSKVSVPVYGCEHIEDAYGALLKAEEQGLIRIRRYKDNSEKMLAWIRRMAVSQYEMARDIPEYRVFLEGKFGEIL